MKHLLRPENIMGLLLIAIAAIGCSSPPTPTALPSPLPSPTPEIVLVSVPECGATLTPDAKVRLRVNIVSGNPSPLSYKWTTGFGTVNPDGGAATIYTPPNTNAPSADVVNATVQGNGFSRVFSCSFTILPIPTANPTSTSTPTATAIPPPPPIAFQKGIALPAWWHNHYCDPPFGPRAILEIKNLGADWIQLVPTQYQAERTSNVMEPDPVKTATDDCLAQAIKGAHNNGLKVMLKPHIDVQDGTPRTEIAPSKPSDWFEKYAEMILKYAQIAAAEKVDLFVIGTELKNLSGTEYTERWRALIGQIKQSYTGRLTYAANWDEYGDIEFWDAMDYIGIEAYFPLVSAENPTRQEILEGWTNYADPGEQISRSWRDEITGFALQKDKPFILTEIGYASQDSAAKEPWNQDQSPNANPALQARLYDVALRTFWTEPKFEGMYWWLWDLRPDAQHIDTGFHPKESARNVLREWYQLDPPNVPPEPTEVAVATATLTATPTKTSQPPPPQPALTHGGYDWESCTPEGWAAQVFHDSRGIASIEGSGDFFHTGKCSIKLNARLRGQHENFSQGEAYITLGAPVSFASKAITCWVYVPEAEGSGPNDSPNGAQVFVKNRNIGNYGFWVNLVEGWNEATLNVGEGAFIGQGFNPTMITIVGVKIGTGGGTSSDYHYEGAYYVDSCSWK